MNIWEMCFSQTDTGGHVGYQCANVKQQNGIDRDLSTFVIKELEQIVKGPTSQVGFQCSLVEQPNNLYIYAWLAASGAKFSNSTMETFPWPH